MVGSTRPDIEQLLTRLEDCLSELDALEMGAAAAHLALAIDRVRASSEMDENAATSDENCT